MKGWPAETDRCGSAADIVTVALQGFKKSSARS